MGKLKEKIIEKGSGLVVKSKTKKQLEKVLPKPLACLLYTSPSPRD